ncbi:SBBP repeat-containing protein [bacterium]|nr:SBBP repeat-containing protein [bacterium]
MKKTKKRITDRGLRITIFCLLLTACCLLLTPRAFAEVHVEWTRDWGVTSSEDDKARSVCVDSAGNTFVAGMIIGNYDGQTNPGGYSSMLTKFDSKGSMLWTRIFGSTASDYAYNITLDSSENVCIAGRTLGEFNGQTGIGESDAYLIKFNSEGSTIWTRVFGSAVFDSANSVCCDDFGNIFVAGYTKGEFAGQTNVNTAKYDFFLTKFNSEGSSLWTRIVGSDNYDYSKGVCCDTNANIFVSGYTQGEFGGESNKNPGTPDMFLVKFNNTGSDIWTRIWGSVANDYSGNVKCDKNGNLLVAGHTSGSFNGQHNSGGYDLCLTKFNNSGSNLWTRIFGSNLNQKDSSVDIDPIGNTFVSGSSYGGFDGQTNVLNGMQNHCAKKFAPNGAALWTRCWGPLGFVNIPYGVAYDKNGNLFTAGYTYVADWDTSQYLTKLSLLPEIEETALVFPSDYAVLHSPAPTNISWEISGITDDAGDTDLTITKISVLIAETTNEIAIVTNNIPNSLGEISWFIPENLIGLETNYILKFEVADSVSVTNSRIFWENEFTVVPEGGLLFWILVLIPPFLKGVRGI